MASYYLVNPFIYSDNVYIYGDITQGKKIKLKHHTITELRCDLYVQTTILTHQYIVDGIETFNPNEPHYICYTGKSYNYIICGGRQNYTPYFKTYLLNTGFEGIYYASAKSYINSDNKKYINMMTKAVKKHNNYSYAAAIELADGDKCKNWISLYDFVANAKCSMSIRASMRLANYYLNKINPIIQISTKIEYYKKAEKYYNIISDICPSISTTNIIIDIGKTIYNYTGNINDLIHCYKIAVKSGWASEVIINELKVLTDVKKDQTKLKRKRNAEIKKN